MQPADKNFRYKNININKKKPHNILWFYILTLWFCQPSVGTPSPLRSGLPSTPGRDFHSRPPPTRVSNAPPRAAQAGMGAGGRGEGETGHGRLCRVNFEARSRRQRHSARGSEAARLPWVEGLRDAPRPAHPREAAGIGAAPQGCCPFPSAPRLEEVVARKRKVSVGSDKLQNSRHLYLIFFFFLHFPLVLWSVQLIIVL